MTTGTLAERILRALTGEAVPTPADARALADALQTVLTQGTPQQVTDLLSRLVQAGVIVVQGDVNVARDEALLITRSDVQLAPGQDVIVEALQAFRHRIAEDQAVQTQVRVAEYLAALRDYCANLPYLTLHDIRPPKTLDEVYVPLKARPQPRKDKDLTGLRRTEGSHDLSGLGRHEPLSISGVMHKHDPPHVLILGEPGAGKSTLLRQLAEHAWDAPDKIGLDAPHLPVLVPLRRLAAAEGALEERLNHALTAELTLTQALPQGFFANWPKQTGANWLLLLDALDEVPAEQRAQTMQWLKGLLNHIGQNRVVLTSRPSGYVQGELDDKLFGHYDLLSFTPDQTGEFAHRWFDEPCEGSEPSQGSAEHFLKELDRVRAGALSGTPLLLTIAAKVYLDKGALPERRSGLYGQFVDIWLNEAEQRGLRAELGDPVCDVAKFALAHLALAMTEQPARTETSLSKVAADYLREAVPLFPDRAKITGERFLKVMARRSGVFTCRGDNYDFIHPTFREYLAALAIVQEYRQSLRELWRQGVSRWNDKRWREVALLVITILADEGEDVTPLVKQIWWRDDLFLRILGDITEGVFFVVDILAEQIRVDADLVKSIMDHLVIRVPSSKFNDVSDFHNLVGLLKKLHNRPRAIRGLLMLTSDKTVDEWIHLEAFDALSCLEQIADAHVIPELEYIAQQDKDEDVRQAAQVAIEQIRQRTEHDHDDT